jgi:antitoxin (DNA-binding transcriptional repressor) of toxin-antitoxin stability system
MEKNIAAFNARRQFDKVLNDVVVRGDRFLVERHGQLVAAVVPIEIYEQWKRQREAFFAKRQEVAERVNLPEDEAMERARDAVQSLRSGSGNPA